MKPVPPELRSQTAALCALSPREWSLPPNSRPRDNRFFVRAARDRTDLENFIAEKLRRPLAEMTDFSPQESRRELHQISGASAFSSEADGNFSALEFFHRPTRAGKIDVAVNVVSAGNSRPE